MFIIGKKMGSEHPIIRRTRLERYVEMYRDTWQFKGHYQMNFLNALDLLLHWHWTIVLVKYYK